MKMKIKIITLLILFFITMTIQLSIILFPNSAFYQVFNTHIGWTIYLILIGLNIYLLITLFFEYRKKSGPSKITTVDLELDNKITTSETFIRKMLYELKENVAILSKEIEDHDNKLEDHKTNITDVSTLSTLKEIQETLAGEINNILDSNSKLNKNLKSAQYQIVEQQEDLTLLRKQVITDELTGLYNRRGFDNVIAKEFRRAKRYNRNLSMIIGDIDHFKKINDNHGHLMGDKILQVYSSILKKNLRESDICARIGGEEFAVILPEQDEESAINIAEKIRQLIMNSKFVIENVRINFTSSFGVASAKKSSTIKDLFKIADKALYQAKKMGRNMVFSSTQLENLKDKEEINQ
jgi:diguanylate cyclase (GGDEF)-like protein